MCVPKTTGQVRFLTISFLHPRHLSNSFCRPSLKHHVKFSIVSHFHPRHFSGNSNWLLKDIPTLFLHSFICLFGFYPPPSFSPLLWFIWYINQTVVINCSCFLDPWTRRFIMIAAIYCYSWIVINNLVSPEKKTLEHNLN
jgi:hypothetical protein